MWFHLDEPLPPIVWCCSELREVSVGLFQPEFLSLFSTELREQAGLSPWWLHGIQLHLHPALLSPFHPLYVLTSNCPPQKKKRSRGWILVESSVIFFLFVYYFWIARRCIFVGIPLLYQEFYHTLPSPCQPLFLSAPLCLHPLICALSHMFCTQHTEHNLAPLLPRDV